MTNSMTRQAITDEARRRGWEVRNATPGGEFYWIDNKAGTRKLVRGARIETPANARMIAQHKLLSYEFLRHNGYNIPDFMEHATITESMEFIKRHGKIVVKPVDSDQSKGVTVGVSDENALLKAIEYALQYSTTGSVVLQQQLDGRLYRLLVVGDRLFAAAYRRPAYVTGDGIHTIRELIEEKNKHPWRSGPEPTPLKKIAIESVVDYLGEDVLDEIPEKGAEKELLAIASVSLGGEAQDVTEEVSPSTAAIVTEITKELGLAICGFDIMCEDIATGFENGFFPIVEMNSLPGFKLHMYPTAGGKPRNPAPLVLDNAFGIDKNS